MTLTVGQKHYRKNLAPKHRSFETVESLIGFSEIPNSPGIYIDQSGRIVNAIYYTAYRVGNFYIGKNGYKASRMGGKLRYLHRLLALTFIENPKGLPTVNHKNGDKLDNRLENLEWASYSENNKHAYDTELKARGSNIKGSKFSEQQVRMIKEKLAAGRSCNSLAKELTVSMETIRAIKIGKTWKWVV